MIIHPQWLKWTVEILGGLVLVCMVGWSVLAIYYSDLPAKARLVAAILFGLGSISAVVFVRPLPWGVLIPIGGFMLVVVWYLAAPPSNTRNWQPDVRVLPHATVEGNKVTIHNVRNCDYRTETDYEVHHDDRIYDLDRLRTVDLFIVYWRSPFHTPSFSGA